MEHIEQVKQWLQSDHSDIQKGALLMLKSNRNRILYDSVLIKKNVDKIIYELKKYLELNPTCTDKEVIDIATKADKITLKEPKGKRFDHLHLPPQIQTLYEANIAIYGRMRSLHEKLKLMTTGYTPCDRYPFLKELLEKDALLRANWKKYDAYTPEMQKADEVEKLQLKMMDAREVSAHRAFLSRNKAVLAQLIEEGNQEKADALREKMSKRYLELVGWGQSVDDSQTQELVNLGVRCTQE